MFTRHQICNMSESFHFSPRRAEQNIPPAAQSLLDPLIDDEIRYTLAQNWIDPVETAEIRQARRSMQVDKICFNLALHHETEEAAVKLRSLYLVRSMDVETRELLSDESWDYTYYLNDFWMKVEAETYGLLPQLADEVFTGHATESLSLVNPSTVIGVQTIARFGTRSVLRETYRTIDQPLPHTVRLRIPQLEK